MLQNRSLLERNIYIITLWRLSVVFLLFSVSRLLFYLFNQSYFEGMTTSHLLTLMGSGLKFDLTAILYTNILFLVLMILPFRFRYNSGYQLAAKIIFIATNSIALAANFIDFVYFRYINRRTDFGVFTEFGNDDNIAKVLGKAVVQNWYVVAMFIPIIFLLINLYGKARVSSFRAKNWSYYLGNTVLMFICIWLIICGMRGGFGMATRPITLANAGESVKQPNETAIVLNTPFSIYRTLARTTFKRFNFYDERKLATIYSPIHAGKPDSVFQKKNVVILILESFSKEHSGYFNKQFNGKKYNGYTPFLDSLAQQGKTWIYSYANGVKSIDAIPSVLGGIPSLVQPYILSRYSLNKMEGLPSILGKEGYYTAFFHGAPNGSMGFDAITNVLGFQHYFGKNEYNNNADYDGFWGIRDEEFLQYFARSMDKMPQPFMTSVFTLSSHHPFIIPQRYESIFKGGTMPVHRTVQYADYALKRFFETVSKTSWYKNTLFVIVADHSLPSKEHDEYKSPMGVFSIPIIFYETDSKLKQIDSTHVIQQIDIMPTILGRLNYQKPYFAFGRDHFDNSQKPFVSNYINGVYQYIDGDYTIHSDGEKLIAVFEYKKDPLSQNNLVQENRLAAQLIFARFKAFLQQYNNRMIDNKLTLNDK